MLNESKHLLHKSHNAPVPCTAMHHFVTNMHTAVAIWCIVGYLSDALWHLWDGLIDSWSYFLTYFTDKNVTNDWRPYSYLRNGSPTIFHRNSNSMDISFCSQLRQFPLNWSLWNLHTRHDIFTVVSKKKSYNEFFSRRFGITMEKWNGLLSWLVLNGVCCHVKAVTVCEICDPWRV